MTTKKLAILAAAGALAILPAVQADANLLTNGSFETPNLSTVAGCTGAVVNAANCNTKGWAVFNSIDGWTSNPPPDGVGGDQGIEVQRSGTGEIPVTWTAAEGKQWIELDSHPAPNSNSSAIAYEVTITPGLTYELSFSWSPRPNQNVTETNRLKVFWETGGDGSNELFNLAAANNSNATIWTMESATFKPTDAPLTITFTAFGNDDTLGGFIDNVSLEVVPIPAALPMLGAAAAGLGFAGWRRRRNATV